MMVGRVFLVLTVACQFGHGVGGFTIKFIHSFGSSRYGKPIIRLGPPHLFTLALAATSNHFALRICAGDLKNEPKRLGR